METLTARDDGPPTGCSTSALIWEASPKGVAGFRASKDWIQASMLERESCIDASAAQMESLEVGVWLGGFCFLSLWG